MAQVRATDNAAAERSLDAAVKELNFLKMALDEHAIVCVADANQSIVSVNEKFCQISQFDPDDLIGGHFCIGIGDEHTDEFFTEMIDTTRGGSIWHGQLCNRRKDGSVYWTDTSIVPFCDSAGIPDKYVVIRTDITKQKTIEEEIRAKNNEIEQAHREVKEAHSELLQGEKLASIGRLAAGIAHEINTPTQYVSDNTRFLADAFGDLAQLLALYHEVTEVAKGGAVPGNLLTKVSILIEEVDLDFLSEEIPTAIEQALEGVARISEIVLSMKEFSHPGSKNKIPVNLNRAIETTATVSKGEWKYCAELITEFDESLPEVPCLPGEFNQVILNLLVNGAHAIAEKHGEGASQLGSITVRTRRDGDFAEIEISDSGSGIPEDIRSKIFDPFFTTKEVGKGTGQGLSVARSVIVDKHQGTIRVESQIDKGSCFTIRLPLEKSEIEANSNSTSR